MERFNRVIFKVISVLKVRLCAAVSVNVVLFLWVHMGNHSRDDSGIGLNYASLSHL